MGSFGERLRREREQRGITLDDVALTTKIRAGLLRALEEEKFEQLPGGIFNKGFVRAYARHLGIDEEQAVADYLVASGETPIVRHTSDAGTARDESTEPRIQLVSDDREARSASSTPWGMKAGLLLLLVVGVAAWFYYHSERRNENSSGPVLSAANPSSAPPAAASSSLTPSDAAPISPAPQTARAPETPSDTLTLQLRADEECWMKITSDGKTEEVTLPANGEKAITAKERILVRVGNVGALNISFDGKRLPPQGEYGEVKTLSFGPKGLEVPAPAAAPQPALNPPAEVHP